MIPVDLFKIRSEVCCLAIVSQVILPVSSIEILQHGHKLDVGLFDLVFPLLRMYLESGFVFGLEKFFVFILGEAPLAEAESG
jgi:hypothetical protein